MAPRVPVLDSTLSLLFEGYGWLPNRRRRSRNGIVHTRVMGRRAVGLCGPAAVEFFYDETNVERGVALPEPVRSTLFGHGGVQGLDGAEHRHRKALFTSLLMNRDGVADLVGRATAEWDRAALSWAERPRVVVFDEAAAVLTRAVCGWAGVPLPSSESDAMASDLMSMVDGFATLGPRHWRARMARKRREDWFERQIEGVRSGHLDVPTGSALATVAHHTDVDGARLPARVAAVELINIIRPTVAMAWYMAFAAHAFAVWPHHKASMRSGSVEGAWAFAQELRRFYPFAPFVGGQAAGDRTFAGEPIPAGSLVLLDLYGQNHDPAVFDDPYVFDPDRFVGTWPEAAQVVAQGGGDPATGHRCPGEDVTIAVLGALATRLASVEYDVPKQDLTISLSRIPARPRSGVVLANVR